MVESIVASPATGAELLTASSRRTAPRRRTFGVSATSRDGGRCRSTRLGFCVAGVSMFGTSEASLQIARCRPAGVAHVRLEVGRGIHFARTGRPGHYTVWEPRPSSSIPQSTSIGHPETMTYGVLYIDEGNFLNWYERREDAERAVLEVAQRDPAEASAYAGVARGKH
jgi:hypothetical protein